MYVLEEAFHSSSSASDTALAGLGVPAMPSHRYIVCEGMQGWGYARGEGMQGCSRGEGMQGSPIFLAFCIQCGLSRLAFLLMTS